MTSSIDVLIPSRQRASLLDRAVQSLWENATDKERVKYLVAVDQNDPELSTYQQLNCSELIFARRLGYEFLHSYYNGLAAWPLYSGDWMLLWNDDAMMLTEGWDDIIAAEDHTVPNVLNFTGELNLFPAVSRPFYDVLGHLSLQCHTDTWIQEVARAARIEKPLMGKIQIDHVRERIDDETKRATQRLYEVTSPAFMSDEMKRLRTEDVKKIQGAMNCIENKEIQQEIEDGVAEAKAWVHRDIGEAT